MMLFKRAKPLLGTFIEIWVKSSNEDHANTAISEAFNVIKNIEACLSFHQESSEVNAINNSYKNTILTISNYLYEILLISKELYIKSNKIFNISFRNNDFDFLNDIDLTEENKIKINKEVKIDLGGIGKGFAVDKGVEKLIGSGFQTGGINAGGDMKIFGKEQQALYIRSPLAQNKAIKIKEDYNCAIATSANYFRNNSHTSPKDPGIINPTNKQIWDGNRSISIISPSCAISDALTKVVAMVENSLAEKILNNFKAEAIILEH